MTMPDQSQLEPWFVEAVPSLACQQPVQMVRKVDSSSDRPSRSDICEVMEAAAMAATRKKGGKRLGTSWDLEGQNK